MVGVYCLDCSASSGRRGHSRRGRGAESPLGSRSKGKSSGVRVIYFNQVAQGAVVLITLYLKANQANIQTSDIKKAR